MRKNIITLLSVVLLVFSLVYTYRYLNGGSMDSKLDIISLNSINNTESFLWIDKKSGETSFSLYGVDVESIPNNINPYFEIKFNINNKEGIISNIDGFIFSSDIGTFSSNVLKVFYNEVIGNNSINIIVKADSDIVNDGNYFLDVKMLDGSFDFTEINDNIPLRLDLPVHTQSPPLKIWLIIFLVALSISIILWFLLLKNIYFPTFSKKGQLNITEPDMSTIFLRKNVRQVIIGNQIKVYENIFTKIFYGKIQYEYKHTNHSVTITPYKDWKTKKLLYRISCKGSTQSEIINTTPYLKHLDKYKLITNDQVLSFEYFNIKH